LRKGYSLVRAQYSVAGFNSAYSSHLKSASSGHRDSVSPQVFGRLCVDACSICVYQSEHEHFTDPYCGGKAHGQGGV